MKKIEYRNLANTKARLIVDSDILTSLDDRQILIHFNGFLKSKEELSLLKERLLSAIHGIDSCLEMYNEQWDFSEEWNEIRQEEYSREQESVLDGIRKSKASPKPGSVYLMHDTANDHYKIGYSKDPIYRERTLQSEKPTIELIGTVDAPISYEKQLHETYKECRVRGEWFNIPEDQQEELKRLFY